MSGIATAVVGGAVLGGAAAMTLNQKPTIDSGYNQSMEASAQQDQQMNQDMMNLYKYNTMDPYGTDLPVTPYKSTQGPHAGQTGYYMDLDRNTAMSEEQYNEKTDNGRKTLSDRFEWVPVNLTPEAQADNSQYALEQKQNAALNEMMPDVVDYEKSALAAEQEKLPYTTEAYIAKQKQIADVAPGQTSAINASNQYVTDTMPVKADTDIASMQEQQRAIEYRKPIAEKYYNEALTGLDPLTYMNTAGQETAHQFEKGKTATTQNLRALGVDPSSGAGAKAFEGFNLDRAKAIAASRTAAKQSVEDTNFERLHQAMGV